MAGGPRRLHGDSLSRALPENTLSSGRQGPFPVFLLCTLHGLTGAVMRNTGTNKGTSESNGHPSSAGFRRLGSWSRRAVLGIILRVLGPLKTVTPLNQGV